VFFETADALVPSDTNGTGDVYEFQGARPSLISSGTSSSGSILEDVSETGSDVFFLSTQQLVPQDNQEGLIVLYDARVAGGFAEPVSPPPCTTADACRQAPAPQPLIFGAPSSQTFSGVGNLAPGGRAPNPKPAVKPKPKTLKCRNGFVKRRIKRKTVCVRNKARKASRSVHANRTGK
jgi:hypothetical protein